MTDRGPIAGGFLPRSLRQTAELVMGDIRFEPDNKQDLGLLGEAAAIKLAAGERDFLEFPTTVLYSPLPYLPQTAAVLVGRLAGASPLVLLYLARLLNLVVWIVLMVMAIRITPIFKWVFTLLALTPMSLALAASASADALTNALAFLLVALVLDTALGPNQAFDRRRWGFILTLSLAVTLAKPVYAILPLSFGLIPAARAGTRKRFAVLFSILIASCLAALAAWSLVASFVSVPLQTGADPRAQVGHILRQPVLSLAVMIDSAVRCSRFYLREFIGQLGWLDVTLWFPLVAAVFVGLWITAAADQAEGVKVTGGQKMTALGVFAAGAFLIMGSIYVFWNPVAGPAVEGVQGRYFIPLSPFLFLIVYNRRFPFRLRTDSLLRTALVCFSLCSAVYALAAVVLRFYRV